VQPHKKSGLNTVQIRLDVGFCIQSKDLQITSRSDINE